MSGTSSDRPLAVVTGASRGLGAALARYLAGEGYDLVLVARTAGALAAVRESTDRFGTRAETVAGDLVRPEVRAEVVRAVAARGRLDLLVNNAAVLGTTPFPELADYPLEELEAIWRVNVVAPIALLQQLLPALADARGLVINISSDAAVGGYPGWGGYGATKAALDLVSLTFAHELVPRGVTVVSVDPGDMRTPGVEAALPAEEVVGRPPPEVTVPFWAWLLHQDRSRISGHRFRAQAERWEIPA
jgi:NAD(P)-dependent dehydrogenase (short-subunit alcohol dehydrogenase family)